MVNTDEMFNRASRTVSAKLDIYFDASPVSVTKDDYLVDFDMLEEVWDSTTGILGNVVANTLDATILNDNRIFSPTNSDGPYYGKIKKGVKISLYMRADEEADWLWINDFYVTDWTADSSGISVAIYASDNMTNVFNKEAILIRPKQAMMYKEFLQYYFDTIGIAATIDSSLNSRLQWAWSTGSIVSDLSMLSQATWAYLGYSRSETLQVKSLAETNYTRATLTDSDQVINVSAKQSIVKTYDGVKLTYYFPSLVNGVVAAAKDVAITAGINAEMQIPFKMTPVAHITHVNTSTAGTGTTVYDYKYDPYKIFLTLSSTGYGSTTSLEVYGNYLTIVEYTKVDVADHLFENKNIFVQFGDYATVYKTRLNKYVASDLPTIEAEIRGNMLFKLGDKIQINSDYFATQFNGKIIKMQTHYNGSLSQKITLLDSEILEV